MRIGEGGAGGGIGAVPGEGEGGAGGGIGGEGEGVSRWKQRQAAKQMMYALSQEGSGDVTARRKLQETQKYEPSIGDWKGKVWGLASSKVINRQDASTTRFSGSGNGEVYYGERRQLSSTWEI